MVVEIKRDYAVGMIVGAQNCGCESEGAVLTRTLFYFFWISDLTQAKSTDSARSAVFDLDAIRLGDQRVGLIASDQCRSAQLSRLSVAFLLSRRPLPDGRVGGQVATHR